VRDGKLTQGLVSGGDVSEASSSMGAATATVTEASSEGRAQTCESCEAISACRLIDGIKVDHTGLISGGAD
jgi:hypothetical protein